MASNALDQPPTVQKSQRYIGWWLGLCIALCVALAAMTLAWVSSQQSNRTSRAIQGSCQFYRDLSELPITPTATRPLLVLIADARIAYNTAECYRNRGQLLSPDPRVALILRERR